VADRLIELTRELYDAFNRGDLETLISSLDPEVETHDPDRTGAVHRGRDGYRAFMGEWLESWEEYSVELTELTANGDKVLAEATQTGIGKGSGIEFSASFTQVLTFRGEKVVRFEIFLDRTEAERAAGLG